jgi:3-hydroxyisobutyrate dehydrogenase-like beta-hydroxyacid dehydrogenase
MAQIAILHPGEMGAAIGAALVELGHDVGWRPDGRSPLTRQRAESAGLREWSSVAGCDLVVSLCPPAAALSTAESIGDFAGLYLDANAISPATADAVSALVRARGADYVDGGVIGSPPTRPGTTRLYLSGPRSADAATLFEGSRLEPRVLEGPDFAASALKMSYAAWTKISSALLLAARASAAANGVEEALVEEWALSQPDLGRRYRHARSSAAAKGWRWEDEMHQIQATFDSAGQPGGFGAAAAAVFGRYPRPPA